MESKIAVQMYTVRAHTESVSDLAATLKKIAAIGYRAVQLSAVRVMSDKDPKIDVKTARKMLDDHGIKCIATHRPWQRLQNNLAEEIALHRELGCNYVAIGGINGTHPATYTGFRQFVEEVRPVIAGLKEAGISFAHHNHSYEFYRPERHGNRLHDILIDEAPADLMLELDLYWIEHAGLNCVRTLERCHGRAPVIHIKDKEALAESNDTRMAPIGEGNMDWEGIIPACEAAGVKWYCVEQDNCYRDAFDCLKSSYDFLRGKGL